MSKYRTGDRVFAIVNDTVLSITCRSPQEWTAVVFDLAQKKALAELAGLRTVAEAQNKAIASAISLCGITGADVAWKEALVARPSLADG